MAWDDWISDQDYDSVTSRMEREHAEDVMRRAAKAGVDFEQFESLHECDMYLQMLSEGE